MTTDREKLKKEMAKELKDMASIVRSVLEERTDICYIPDLAFPIAKKLFEYYQPKLPKDSVVISREEYGEYQTFKNGDYCATKCDIHELSFNQMNKIINLENENEKLKKEIKNPNNPPKSGSNAYKEDKKIILNVDVTNDIIKPLFNAIDLENSECEPVEMPTIPKHNNNCVIGRNREQLGKGFSINVPKTIAKIKFLGNALVINVPDTLEGFIKPTPKQIKNLKKHFCIDVELMNDSGVEE